MAIEQWGFLSVPHLLWHGASVYNGHLWGPVTLTPIAERLAVELSLPVFTTKVCRGNRYETRHIVVLRLIVFMEGCLFDSWLLNSHRPDWRFLCKTLEINVVWRHKFSPIQHRHKKMCTSQKTPLPSFQPDLHCRVLVRGMWSVLWPDATGNRSNVRPLGWFPTIPQW